MSVALVAKLCGLVSSAGEGRRLIGNGGLRVNDQVVTDIARTIGLDDRKDGVIKLSNGRKKHILIKPA